MKNPLQYDLDHIMNHTEGLWEDLRGKRVFITGGTGFFGCWLLESFVWANDFLGLRSELVVLTRNPEAFMKKAPHLAGHRSVQCHEGDVRDFEFPVGDFSHVIHAASEADTALNRANPLATIDTITSGTCRVLEFSAKANAGKFLIVSSGAIYGVQPSTVARISEDFTGAPDPLDPASAYGESKRMAELLAVANSYQTGLEVKIARGFAFSGPYLPLNGSFAIGNFVGDALGGGPVCVKGDGTARRSYMYGADLVIWLWTILIRGRSGRAYNVGSEDEFSMAEVAEMVARACGNNCSVEIKQKPVAGNSAMRYIPNTQRARAELGLSQRVTMDEGIRKMIRYLRNNK
jgi:nucleoside-diphosphate-sugar epimerase